MPGRGLGLRADAAVATEGGQGWIGEVDALGEELLADAHQVTSAGGMEGKDLLAVGRCLVRAQQGRRLGESRGEDLLQRAARDAEGAGNGSLADAAGGQLENRGARLPLQHAGSPERVCSRTIRACRA